MFCGDVKPSLASDKSSRRSMVSVPGGSFLMGSSAGEANRGDDEGPQREVQVKPFSVPSISQIVHYSRTSIDSCFFRKVANASTLVILAKMHTISWTTSPAMEPIALQTPTLPSGC